MKLDPWHLQDDEGSVGGQLAPSPSLPTPLPLPRCGRGRGDYAPHLPRSGDPAPVSVNDTEAANQHTPLPQRGRGAGGEGGLHLPPGPFLSPWGRGRENVGQERKNIGSLPRNGRTGTVRAR